MTHFKIQQIKTLDKENLIRLVQCQKFFPYDYIRGIEKETFISYLYTEISNLLGRENITIFCAIDDKDKICGLLFFETLKWDSEIFGFPCGRIKFLITEENKFAYQIKFALLSETTAWAKNQNIKYFDIYTHPLDLSQMKALARNDFDLIATHIHHVWDLRTSFKLDYKIVAPIRLATIDDLQKLENLDFSIFPKHSRFYLDEKLMSTQKVPLMFKHWLRNSLLARAKGVWIVEVSDKIIGYVTTVEDESTKNTLGIRITKGDMVGVLPNTRNKGIYTDLVATIIYWAQNYGADILEVAIHVCNAPANSLTSQLRSRIWGAHHNFHWHAD